MDDLSLSGIFITLCYLLTAGAAVWAAQSRAFASTRGKYDWQVWYAAALFFLVFGINKQADLQTPLLELFKVIAATLGLTVLRRPLKIGFAVCLCSATVVAVVLVFRRWCNFSPRAKLVLLGMTIQCLFFAMRAIAILDITPPSFHLPELRWPLELVGISISLLAAVSESTPLPNST